MFNKNITKNSIGDINNVGSVDIGDKTIINFTTKHVNKAISDDLFRIN